MCARSRTEIPAPPAYDLAIAKSTGRQISPALDLLLANRKFHDPNHHSTHQGQARMNYLAPDCVQSPSLARLSTEPFRAAMEFARHQLGKSKYLNNAQTSAEYTSRKTPPAR